MQVKMEYFVSSVQAVIYIYIYIYVVEVCRHLVMY